jgi:S-(hydroxymethyl)glutathione dehydrogenase/alcohol dehydrogenase
VPFGAFELSFSEKHLCGCVYGSTDARTDFDRLPRLWRQGRLKLEELISDRIEPSQVNEAFDAMNLGEAVRPLVIY